MKKYAYLFLIILSACNKENLTPIDYQDDILFMSRRIFNSADWQMFVMNGDGTNQRLLTDTLINCGEAPAVSPDGRRIAFYNYDANRRYNLYVIDRNGQNLTRLVQSKFGLHSPVWSPDSKSLAYIKHHTHYAGSMYVYTINIDGRNEKQLTKDLNSGSPQYFPDGSGIVFASEDGIYKMAVDGGNKQLLTPKNKSLGCPRIAPNGQLIAMLSSDWAGSQIFVMNNDGSNLKQITSAVSPEHWDVGFPRDANSNPVWSPNSGKIAYESYETGKPQIFTINPNGTNKKQLTDMGIGNTEPMWTPDGQYILYSANRSVSAAQGVNYGREIAIMRTEGQLQTLLSNHVSDDINPVFLKK
jgi:TolB protein